MRFGFDLADAFAGDAEFVAYVEYKASDVPITQMCYTTKNMKIKKLTIKNSVVTLPREFEKRWNNAEVAVVSSPTEDTLILKRLQKPVQSLSTIAARNTRPPMSRGTINREIRAYRAKA